MNKDITLVTKAGEHIPTELQAQLLQEFKTGFGYAVALDAGIEAAFLPAKDVNIKDALEQVLATYMDKKIVFHFHESESLNEDDGQPIAVIKLEDAVVVAVSLDGPFPGFDKDDAHSNEFHCVQDYLAEKLKAAFATADDDMDKFVSVLDSPGFRADIRLALLQPRGALTVLVGNGQAVSFSHSMEAKEYPWGWASQPLEAAVAAKAADAAPAKEMSLADRLRASKTAKAGPVAEKPTQKTQTAVGVVGKVTSDKDVQYLNPPGSMNEKGRKKWWNRNFEGQPPKNLMDSGFKIEATKLKKDAPLRQALKSFVNLKDALADEATKVGEEVKKDGDVVAEPIPAIGPQQKKDVLQVIRTQKKPSSAEDLVGWFHKYEPASKQLAMAGGVKDYAKMDFETIRVIARQHPQTAACMFVELLVELWHAKPTLFVEEKPETVATVKQDTSTMTLADRLKASKAAKAA